MLSSLQYVEGEQVVCLMPRQGVLLPLFRTWWLRKGNTAESSPSSRRGVFARRLRPSSCERSSSSSACPKSASDVSSLRQVCAAFIEKEQLKRLSSGLCLPDAAGASAENPVTFAALTHYALWLTRRSRSIRYLVGYKESFMNRTYSTDAAVNKRQRPSSSQRCDRSAAGSVRSSRRRPIPQSLVHHVYHYPTKMAEIRREAVEKALLEENPVARLYRSSRLTRESLAQVSKLLLPDHHNAVASASLSHSSDVSVRRILNDVEDACVHKHGFYLHGLPEGMDVNVQWCTIRGFGAERVYTEAAFLQDRREALAMSGGFLCRHAQRRAATRDTRRTIERMLPYLAELQRQDDLLESSGGAPADDVQDVRDSTAAAFVAVATISCKVLTPSPFAAQRMASLDQLQHLWWYGMGAGVPQTECDAVDQNANDRVSVIEPLSQTQEGSDALAKPTGPAPRRSAPGRIANALSDKDTACHAVDLFMVASEDEIVAELASLPVDRPPTVNEAHDKGELMHHLIDPPPAPHLSILASLYRGVVIPHLPPLFDRPVMERSMFDYSSHERIINAHLEASRRRSSPLIASATPGTAAVADQDCDSKASTRSVLRENLPVSLLPPEWKQRSVWKFPPPRQSPHSVLANEQQIENQNTAAPFPAADEECGYELLLSKLRKKHPHPLRDPVALAQTIAEFEVSPRVSYLHARVSARVAELRSSSSSNPPRTADIPGMSGIAEEYRAAVAGLSQEFNLSHSLPFTRNGPRADDPHSNFYSLDSSEFLAALQAHMQLTTQSRIDTVGRIQAFEALFNELRVDAP